MKRKIKVTYLTDSEKMKLLEFMNTKHIYFKDARNACLLTLLYFGGLKTHQLSSLNQESYNQEDSELNINNTWRKLNEFEKEALDNYVYFRNDDVEPLFVSVRNFNRIQLKKALNLKDIRLTDRSIQRAIKEVCALLKIEKNIKPQDFRHLLGIKLFSFGTSYKDLDKSLDHVGLWVKMNYSKLGKRKKYKVQ